MLSEQAFIAWSFLAWSFLRTACESERALKTDQFQLRAHGTDAEVARAKDIIERTHPSCAHSAQPKAVANVDVRDGMAGSGIRVSLEGHCMHGASLENCARIRDLGYRPFTTYRYVRRAP